MPPLAEEALSFVWRTETDALKPPKLSPIDDGESADKALARVKRGEVLWYKGDFHNAKQLLTAMERRLPRARNPAKSPLEAFRAERRARQLEQATLSHVVVALDENYRLLLARAPDVALACTQVWGPAEGPLTVVPLKTLLGMMGAAEWRKKGLTVPGLTGTLVPHYGVFVPTRTDYVELLGSLKGVTGKRVFDVGTGTGVLSFLLLQQGAASVVATDVDERAVACARENAKNLGFAESFSAGVGDGFPEGRADIVVCNPPWLPEEPKNRLDRAVFDFENRFLLMFINGLTQHLTPDGFGVLLLSDFAELLGLRPPSFLNEALAKVGLVVSEKKSVKARHGKAKDKGDPLFDVRSRETITRYTLRRSP